MFYDFTAIPTIVGCAIAVVVFVIGIASSVLRLLYVKKRRRLIKKFAPRRRPIIQTIEDHVIEGG